MSDYLSEIRSSGLILPAVTERALTIWQALIYRPILSISALLVLIIVDGIVLLVLGRSTRLRIVREFWSGMVVAIPIAFVLYSGVVMIMPYQIMYAALTKTNWAHEQAKSQEGQLLCGSWKLIKFEQDGNVVAVGQDSKDGIQISAEGYRWRKAEHDETGTLQLDLRSVPKRLQFFSTSDPDLGSVRNAIYKVEGDQLTICLPMADAYVDDLPIQFETRGNKNELFVFKRGARKAI